MESSVYSAIKNQDQKFMHVLENLVLIPTVISGDIVEALKGFNSELEKDEFD